jgi:tetratricopeptide (TPR) repeat protein
MSRHLPLPILGISLIALLLLCAPALAYSGEATGWYEKGNALVTSDNLTAAVAAYDRAVALEPDYYEAWDARADALNRDGRFSDALDSSNQALRINSSFVQGWINRGQILYNIGYVYEDQKKDTTKANEFYNQQVLAFEKAIALDPKNADAWFNKGYALAGMKQYDEAIAAFDTVKQLNPTYPKIDKNREIAVQLKESVTPFYVKYAGVLIGAVGIVVLVVVWFVFLREKKEE